MIGCGIPLDCIANTPLAGLDPDAVPVGLEEKTESADFAAAPGALDDEGESFFGRPTGRFVSGGGFTDRAI